MGAIYSFERDYKEAQQAEDEDREEATPNRVLRNKRLVQFDPRSPSASISRTPIIVDKTPGRLPSTPEPETSGGELNVDPRSPTHEFLRTPILPQFKRGQDADDACVKEERPLQDDVRPISLCYSSESGFGSADVSPELRAHRGSSSCQCPSPDSVVSQDPSEVSSEDNVALRPGQTTSCGVFDGEDQDDGSPHEKLPLRGIENLRLQSEPSRGDSLKETPKLTQTRGDKKRRGLQQTSEQFH